MQAWFEDVATDYQGESTFVVWRDHVLPSAISTATAVDIRGAAMVQLGMTAVLKDGVIVLYTGGKANREDFGVFVDRHRFPFLPELTRKTYSDLLGNADTTALLALDPNDDRSSDLRQVMRRHSEEHGDSHRFAWIDAVQWDKYLKQFGVESQLLPQLVVINQGGNGGYFMAPSPLETANVPVFFSNISHGLAERLGYSYSQAATKYMHELALMVDEAIANQPYAFLAGLLGVVCLLGLLVCFCEPSNPHTRHGMRSPEGPQSTATTKDETPMTKDKKEE